MQLIVGNVTWRSCSATRAEPLIVHSSIYSTLVGCDVIPRESKQIIEYSTFSVISIDRHSYPHSTFKANFSIIEFRTGIAP